jgi:hypothetical protein
MDDAERRRAERYAVQMTNVYGAPARIKTLAEDLVAHWEKRSELMRPQLGGPGKAMIVCASREVCVRVYDALAELRPEWAKEAMDKGTTKIVFPGGEGKDPVHLRQYALRPSQHKAVQARAKDTVCSSATRRSPRTCARRWPSTPPAIRRIRRSGAMSNARSPRSATSTPPSAACSPESTGVPYSPTPLTPSLGCRLCVW